MNKFDELVPLIEELPEYEVRTAKSFLQFLIQKAARESGITKEYQPEIRKKNFVSIRGITSGSPVADEDFEEVKRIWQ